MKKSLFASLMLHLSLVALVTVSVVAEERQEEEKFEIELQESQQSEAQINVIELGDVSSEDLKPLDNFYWGLGFGSQHYMYDKIPGQLGALPVIEVTEIFKGYCGESVLQKNDLIYLINDMPLVTGNDIRGEGPAKLKLTILRNGGKIVLNVERCKVYY